LFFDELSTVLETLFVLACPVVIGSDFNVKVQLTGDFGARRMRKLLTRFDMVHTGNTLDLVITPSTSPLNDVDNKPAGRYSDHSLVVCSLLLAIESLSAV